MNQRENASGPGALATTPRVPPHRHGGRRPTARAVDDRPQPIDFLTEPSIARVCNYLLGGKDHFAVDREIARRLLELAPETPAALQADRDFKKRVVRHLARAHGVRQFIDIGMGLPAEDNVHEIAQRVDPDARVVYVDNDPVALSHARALLAVDRRVTVVEGDLRDPAGLLDHEATLRLIDFTEPVAVLMIGVLHFLTADHDPPGIVAHVRDAIAPGSHLAISHVVARPETARCAEALGYEKFGRTKEEIMGFFDGLQQEPPGLVSVFRWQPGVEGDGEDDLWLYAGVGRTRSA
ncbi:SAM-dependent methyltransferase [Actinoallomurus liliacearum]|uniref:SAM-dependent methyltransferase n=1 Tax=Actinoallomurus liliacearum TaxID=1080073 RepID=A0ABP8TBK4_9ACTN